MEEWTASVSCLSTPLQERAWWQACLKASCIVGKCHLCESDYADWIHCVCNASVHLEPDFTADVVHLLLGISCLTERIQNRQGPTCMLSRVQGIFVLIRTRALNNAPNAASHAGTHRWNSSCRNPRGWLFTCSRQSRNNCFEIKYLCIWMLINW